MTDSTKNIYSAQKSAGGKLVENENVVIGNVSFIIHSNIFTETLRLYWGFWLPIEKFNNI